MPNQANIPEDFKAKMEKNLSLSSEWMKDQQQDWKNFMKCYRPQKRASSLTPQVKVYMYLAIIETMMPVIEDYWPNVNYMPREENDVQGADMMQLKMDQIYTAGKFKDNALDVVKDAKIIRNGILQVKPSFRETPEGLALAGIEYVPVDMNTFRPSPGYTGLDILNGEAAYIGFEFPMHIDMFKAIYQYDDVEPDGGLDEYGMFTECDKETADQVLIKEYFSPSEDYSGLIHTITSKDYDLKHAPAEDGLGHFLLKNYGQAHTGKGISEIELIKPLNEIIDSLMSNTADMAINLNKPIIKAKQSWINKVTDFFMKRRTGQVIPDEGGEFAVIPSPEVPQTNFSAISMSKDFINTVSGIYDNFAGKAQGDQSGRMVLALQEAALRRVRLFLDKDLKPFMDGVALHSMQLVQKYDREAQMLRKEDTSGNPVFVKFDPMSIRDTEFDIQISVSAGAPKGRVAAVAEALDMYEKGLYGAEEVFDVLQVQNKAEKLERYNERQGVSQMQQIMDAGEEAEKEMEKLAKEMLTFFDKEPETLTEADRAKYKIAEQEMAQLIDQNPALLNTIYWEVLPKMVKDKILRVFSTEPDVGEPGAEEVPAEPVEEEI